MRLAAVTIATFSRPKVSATGSGPRSGTLLNPAPLAGGLAPQKKTDAAWSSSFTS